MTTTKQTNPRDLAIDKGRAALLVIDIQERLAAVMPEERLARVERNVAILCEAARRFDLPVVVSEQYPKGLGPSTPAVQAALEPLGDQARRLEKVEFSVCEADGFAGLEQELERDQWIVTGMETHVCVYQTARELCAEGKSVHVVTDAVVSRFDTNREIGLALMQRAGAIPTSTETVVFDLLGKAGGDDFKALSKLIK